MSYCLKCGAALPLGASFCGACGTPVGSTAPALPPPRPAYADPDAPTLGIAIVALVLNVIVWPGLGTLVGGDKNGWTQGFLFLLGGVLFFMGAVLLIVGIGLILLLVAVPLMLGMWVWGTVSGVRLIERANAKERATR